MIGLKLLSFAQGCQNGSVGALQGEQHGQYGLNR